MHLIYCIFDVIKIILLDLSKEFLFFFSLLGVFNGFLVAVYFLFFVKENIFANKFLGTLLLVLSIRIGKSVLLYFDRDLIIEIVEVGVLACMFIGPLLYLYVSANSGAIKKLKAKQAFHLVPIAGIIVYFLFNKNGNYSSERTLISNIMKIIYFQWAFYLIASAIIIKSTAIKLFNKGTKYLKTERWNLSVFIGVFLLWLSYVTFRFTSYIAGAVVFSFMFYIMVLVLYDRKEKRKKQKKLLEYDSDELNKIDKQIEQLFKVEKVFTKKDLKMPEMARMLDLTPHQLSEFLNINLNKNFSTFINEYRVIEAKKLLSLNNHYTIEHIGDLSGFKSTSAFYNAFKKHSGLTPSAFRDNN